MPDANVRRWGIGSPEPPRHDGRAAQVENLCYGTTPNSAFHREVAVAYTSGRPREGSTKETS
jgi:hypothetical protein